MVEEAGQELAEWREVGKGLGERARQEDMERRKETGQENKGEPQVFL